MFLKSSLIDSVAFILFELNVVMFKKAFASRSSLTILDLWTSTVFSPPRFWLSTITESVCGLPKPFLTAD
ncbi:MAG TPA: hypothetical protein DGG95_18465 [Cytophagales bacterium]|nr:hypothetical protein [Cytophagales bacterium]